LVIWVAVYQIYAEPAARELVQASMFVKHYEHSIRAAGSNTTRVVETEGVYFSVGGDGVPAGAGEHPSLLK
jgi:hypothetical protein